MKNSICLSRTFPVPPGKAFAFVNVRPTAGGTRRVRIFHLFSLFASVQFGYIRSASTRHVAFPYRTNPELLQYNSYINIRVKEEYSAATIEELLVLHGHQLDCVLLKR